MSFFKRKSRVLTPEPEPEPVPALPAFETSPVFDDEIKHIVESGGNTPSRTRSISIGRQSFHRPTSTFHPPVGRVPLANATAIYTNNINTSTRSLPGKAGTRIADLFTTPKQQAETPKTATLPNVRKSNKVPPTFNILVAGASKTGKTSFIRTLLGNVSLATADKSAAARELAVFGMNKNGRLATTKKIRATSVEIVEQGDRYTLSVVDTPGLDIPLGPGRPGDEQACEKSVTNILKILEARFEDTLKAETTLFRHSHRAHDNHVHLIIYLIHPESLLGSPATKGPFRVGKSRTVKPSIGPYMRSLTSPQRLRTAVMKGEESVVIEDVGSDEDDDVEPAMCSVDLACLKRLSQRANVLPILARSDELSLSELETYKAVIKRDLKKHGIPMGMFTSPELARPAGADSSEDQEEESEELETFALTSHADNYRGSQDESVKSSATETLVSKEPPKEEPTMPIPAAKELLKQAGLDFDDDPVQVSPTVPEAPADNVIEISVAPAEESSKVSSPPTSPIQGRLRSNSSPSKVIRLRSVSRHSVRRQHRAPTQSDEEDSDDEFDLATLLKLLPFAVVGPDPLEEGYIRRFRHGTLNVINPEHSDFMALRKTVLGKQLSTLKDTTRLTKYEPFRTQRLLTKRDRLINIPGFATAEPIPEV